MNTIRYQPFNGYTAWFSSSVHPDHVKQWDCFGGKYASKDVADFLFSESAFEEETSQVYDSQQGTSIFRPSWLTEVIQSQKNITEISIGPHLLIPHYSTPAPTNQINDIFKTPLQEPRQMILPPMKKLENSVTLKHLCSTGIENRSRNQFRTTSSHSKPNNMGRARSKRSNLKLFCKTEMKDTVHIDELQEQSPCIRFQNIKDVPNIIIILKQ